MRVYSPFLRSSEGVSKNVTFLVSPEFMGNDSWLNEKEEFPMSPVLVNVDEAIILRLTCSFADTLRGISVVFPLLIFKSVELVSTTNGRGLEPFNMPNLFSVHSENHSWLFFPIEN